MRRDEGIAERIRKFFEARAARSCLRTTGARRTSSGKREAAIESHDDRRQRVKGARAEIAILAPSRTIEEAKVNITKMLAANPKAGDCRNATANTTARYVSCA